MPARIVVVHDDPDFVETVRTSLQLENYDVIAFTDTLAALKALEAARLTDILITGTRFPAGTPNGVSLALMARYKRPNVKILVAAAPEHQEHADGIGEILPYPVDIPYLLTIVRGLIGNGCLLPKVS
ncbi:MAG: hypothetical protein ACREFD_14135 [Stellaceae bacterium]